MTESEFEHICRSKFHLSMIANRDGNTYCIRFGLYPFEDNYDILIPVIERTPTYILGLLGSELNTEPLWKRDVPLFSKVVPPIVLGDSDSIDPALVRKYLEFALDRIKQNTCEVCGNLGAYPTPVDPYHRICHRCREALHINHTGWHTSNPHADIHGGIE